MVLEFLHLRAFLNLWEGTFWQPNFTVSDDTVSCGVKSFKRHGSSQGIQVTRKNLQQIQEGPQMILEFFHLWASLNLWEEHSGNPISPDTAPGRGVRSGII